MKKIKFFLLLMILVSGISYAKTISIKGFSEMLSIVKKIAQTQTGMNLELLEQGVNQVKQLENEYKMLENEYKNLLRLGQEVKDGNIYALESLVQQLVNIKSNALSMIYDQNEIIGQYWEVFKKDPEAFEEVTGFNEESIKEINRQTRIAEKEARNAVYDAMTSAGFVADIENDEANVRRLVQAAGSSEGALQALQAIAHLIGNTNSILLKIGTQIESIGKMNAAVEAGTDTGKLAEQDIEEIYNNTVKKETDIFLENVKQDLNKDIKVGF